MGWHFDVQQSAETMQLCCTECPYRAVRPLPEVLAREIGLIEDIPDNLLENIFERDDALEIAILVDNQRHVTLRLPERAQQRIKRDCFRNDDRFMHKILPIDLIGPCFDELR